MTPRTGTNKVALSIVIPAFNEASRLPLYLAEIANYFEPQDISHEIIVVDDGSHDSTAEVVGGFAAKNDNVKLVRLAANCGKGYAVKTGMLQAVGKLRLFADADGATPIIEWERLRKAVDAGADIAIGSRALRHKDCLVKAHRHRKVMGSIFNVLVKTFTMRGFKDTQCGFKLFTAESASTVFPLQRIDGFGFDIEVLYIGREKGYTLAEVPITWTDIKGSKVSLTLDSFRMFTDIFRVRLNDLRGLYRRGTGSEGS